MNTLLLLALSALLACVAFAQEIKKEALGFKYFMFREDCFDLFFNKHDFFSNQECLKLTISKAIGFGIIAGSAILKLPQIAKILSAGSVEGIAKSLFYIEIVMLINTSAISILKNIPFSIYGEALIILAQNIVIVLLFWVYSKDITAAEKVLMFLFFSGYAFVLFSGNQIIKDEWMWDLISQSNMVLSIASRVPQIITNFQNKSTGQLAFFTFLLNFVGGLARLGTVMIETDDFLYQFQYILGVFLGGIIVFQFIIYWNNKDPSQVAPADSKSKTASPKKASRSKLD